MCKNWSQYRFKSQLHIGFSIFNISVLAAIFVTIFVFTYVTTSDAEKNLRDRLHDAAQGYTRSIASDSARVFDKLLTRVARNFLNVIANSAADYQRSDHPFAPEPTYYEWYETMKPPLVQDPRYNSLVSFENGGYSVAGQSPFTRYRFSAALNSTITKTESIQPLMKDLYQLNPEFLGGYYCLTSEKLFREYPAASNGNFTQMIAYDCTKDEWYLQGRATSLTRVTSFSSVYIDRWVKQTMITVIQPIFDTSSTLIGVAGADLLTTSIQASINSVKYLANGRSILFEINPSDLTRGIVIADTARSIGQQQTQLESYRNLVKPSITTDLWSRIYAVGSDQITAQSTFVEIDDYYIASQPLASGNNQYLLSIFVYKRDVTGVLDPVLDDISTARSRALIINSVVCVFVLLVAIVINLFLARRIVRPLTELTDDSTLLIERIGHDNITKGIQVRPTDSDVSETRALQEAHRAMIQAIQAQQQAIASKEQELQAARIDYALPAYHPGAGFDFSLLGPQGACSSPVVSPLPVGVIISPSDASSMSVPPPPYAEAESSDSGSGSGSTAATHATATAPTIAAMPNHAPTQSSQPIKRASWYEHTPMYNMDDESHTAPTAPTTVRLHIDTQGETNPKSSS